MSRDHIIDLKGQVVNLTRQQGELSEEVAKSSQRASMVKSQWDEALAQLSSLEETCRQQDEAQAQHDEALARAIVIQQELNNHVDDLKGMALAVEKSQLQQQ